MTTQRISAPVNPLETAPRYTTVEDVKEVLGIPATDTTKDLRITEAIVAGEYSIDAELGQSFPSPGGLVFAGPYNADTAPPVTDPIAGELFIDGGVTFRMAKVDAGATDHAAASLDGTPLMLIDWVVSPDQATVEIQEPVTDSGTFWSFTGVLRSGVILTDVEVTADVTVNEQVSGGIGRVVGIPIAVSSVARAVGVSIYKSSEAPFGTAGSDDFLGTVSVPQIVAEEVRRNPQLHGFKVSFGVR